MLLTSILTGAVTRKYALHDLLASSSVAPSDQRTPATHQVIWTASQWSRIANAGDAEVRAARKIADAKEQLEFLRRSGFPAEVIARLAQELGRAVQSAAAEYSASTSGAASAPPVADATVAAETSSKSMVAETVAGQSPNGSGSETEETADRVQVAKVVGVYKSVMEDGDRFHIVADVSAPDDKFKSLLEEIKALVALETQHASSGNA